jgi:hypothetical protein
MKLIEYEIIDHGMEHSQYFQGCGTSHTRFTHVWTGIGDSAKEAYNDALDQMFMDDSEAAEKMPTRPAGFRTRPKVPAHWEDINYIVTIRARLKEGKK